MPQGQYMSQGIMGRAAGHRMSGSMMMEQKPRIVFRDHAPGLRLFRFRFRITGYEGEWMDEVKAWCNETFAYQNWLHLNNGDHTEIAFRRMSDAMVFKMKWDG